VKPPECAHCGAWLFGEDPDPVRHQVFEIPEIKPFVTEWQLHALTCPRCRLSTRATLPEGVPTGGLGPRAQATAAMLTGLFNVGRRMATMAMDELFGIPISLGAQSNCEHTVSEAVAGPCAEAREFARDEVIGNIDETGFRQMNQRAWIWVLVTRFVTIFLVHLSRGRKGAHALLGTFAGFLTSDRWKAYDEWDLKRRQLCWAHILRAFKAFSELKGRAGRIGQELKDEADAMFHLWHRVRDGTLKRTTFHEYMRPIKKRIFDLLEEGTACGHRRTEGTCIEILALEPALWTFIHREGIEPTNNAAERAIRPAVLWRKRSFGSQSLRGSRFVERMMTVSATLKQQGRSIVDFVTRATEAHLNHTRKPSLLPPVALIRKAQAAV
jgi:transposase